MGEETAVDAAGSGFGLIDRAPRFGLRMLGWFAAGAAGAAPLYAMDAIMRDGAIVVIAGGLAFVGLGARVDVWQSATRAFRSLPIAGDRLAAILLLMASAPSISLLAGALAAGLALSAFAAAPPQLPEIVAALLFLLACQSLLLPLRLRFGAAGSAAGRRAGLVLALMMLVAAVRIGPTLDADAWKGLPLLVAGILAILSYFWTRHELRSGRRAFTNHP